MVRMASIAKDLRLIASNVQKTRLVVPDVRQLTRWTQYELGHLSTGLIPMFMVALITGPGEAGWLR